MSGPRRAGGSGGAGRRAGFRLRVRLVAAAVLAGILAVLALPSPAAAHRGKESYLYLDIAPEDLGGRVELPYEDIELLFGLSLDTSVENIEAQLEANYSTLVDYIQDHTSVGANGTVFALEFGDVELLFDEVEGPEPGYAIFPFEAEIPDGPVPQVLDVSFDPFVAELENRRGILLVANDWQRGVFDAEANELLFYNEPGATESLDLGDPSQWRTFRGSVGLGVDHIRTGPDHVFFILALLLPAVLVFAAGSWRPAPNFGSALWRVLKLVTMFTVAHSITFTVAGLDLIPLPPSQLVETIIALSIAGAALHNLRPIFLNREWLLAFVFGLFHGLGFASLVEALDIDRTTQLVSLIGRNVGIEIGQAIVILVAFPALYLLRRTRYYQPLMIAGSVALAVLSLLWAVERIAVIDLGFNRWIELLLQWPRSLFAMIVVTIVAAGIYAVEHGAGRLLDVARSGRDADPAPDAESVPVG